MGKIKQRYKTYLTAERNFNKTKVRLKNEFTSEMHKAIKTKNFKYFEALKHDFVKIMGEEYNLTVTSIELMYGIHESQINSDEKSIQKI